jgi:hypothetical protein
VLTHPLPIGRIGAEHDVAAGSVAQPAFTASQHQARAEPIHVPLERAGVGLVEVVHVEEQAPLR